MELQIWLLSATCFVLCSSTPVLDSKEEYIKLNKELSFIDTMKRIDFLKMKVIDGKKETEAEVQAERDKAKVEVQAERDKAKVEVQAERDKAKVEVQAERDKAKKAHDKAKKAEIDKVNAEKSLLILGMRTRMEEIRDILYPGKIPYGVTNAQAWDDIMTSTKQEFLQHPLVPQFRRDVLSVKDMTIEIFLLTIKELYGPIFSLLAAHKISFLAGKVPKTMNDVEKMFNSIGIIPDVRRKLVVLQLVRPMNLPPSTSSSVTPYTSRNSQASIPSGLFRKKQNKKKRKNQNRG